MSICRQLWKDSVTITLAVRAGEDWTGSPAGPWDEHFKRIIKLTSRLPNHHKWADCKKWNLRENTKTRQRKCQGAKDGTGKHRSTSPCCPTETKRPGRVRSSPGHVRGSPSMARKSALAGRRPGRGPSLTLHWKSVKRKEATVTSYNLSNDAR